MMARTTLVISILIFVFLLASELFLVQKKNRRIRCAFYGFDVLLLFLFIDGAIHPMIAGVGMLISCVAVVVMITASMFYPNK